ncbi:MAG TPA: hypothetical protein VKV15_18485 [Bryobacteraceae bacterium]|nr:hypothetical protein [Bryobacteraceae bacterium]
MRHTAAGLSACTIFAAGLWAQCGYSPTDLVLPDTSYPTNSYTSGNSAFQATNTITAGGGSGSFSVSNAASVTFQAGSQITLLPGFTAVGGSGGTTFVAVIAPVAEYQLSTASSPAPGGSVTVSPCSPNGYYSAGTVVASTATPNGGYQFTNWSTGSGSDPLYVTMSSAMNLTANFSGTTLVSETIATNPSGLSITVDGSPYTAPYTFQWQAGSAHSIAPAANPESGGSGTQYPFSSWSDGGALSHTIYASSSTPTYTANFTTQYYLTTSANGGGSISPASGWYNAGTPNVSISAAPNGGYQFVFFSGGVTGPLSTRTLTMNAPTSVAANFIPQPYGGISPSSLEVNLGPVPIDDYDGITMNGNGEVFPACPGGTVQACMQTFLQNYALQGVTGVRFQFGLGGGAISTAFCLAQDNPAGCAGAGSVNATWVRNLARFFLDLWSYGLTRITPTPVMTDLWSGTLQLDTNMQYPSTYGCPTGGKHLDSFPWLPFGFDPSNHDFPDGFHDNNAWACSPFNTNFWGWGNMQNLVNNIAASAQNPWAALGLAAPPGGGLTIEEFDLQNEVSLKDFTVLARLIYDNTTNTPVFQFLGQNLPNYGYSSTAVTVSVNMDRPASLSANNNPPYPCGSVYGDAAQVLPSSELLAATGGAQVGTPPHVKLNGDLWCDDSSSCNGNLSCITGDMPYVPSSQAQPTVTDAHTKPCINSGGCSVTADATQAAQDIYSFLWDFLTYRGLTGNTVIFGESWANTDTYACDNGTMALAQQSVAGYTQSLLYSQDASKVVFRPWGKAQSPTSCPTPELIGHPTGPYKY